MAIPTTEADKARAIRDAAGELHMSLHLSGNRWNRAQQGYMLKLCNAIIDLIDDGDCLAERERMMDELRCDEGGNPVSDLVPFAKCNANLSGFPGVGA